MWCRKQQLFQKKISSVSETLLNLCFINNKTPEYLENLSQAEKHKMITRAIQEAPNKLVAYSEKEDDMRSKDQSNERKK